MNTLMDFEKRHIAEPEIIVRERCKDCGVFLGYRKLSQSEKNEIKEMVSNEI